jgi:hypothetical protein
MSRRTAAATATLATLLLGTAVPLLGTSSAAGCPLWTDKTGDSTTQGVADPSGQVYDANLDLVKTSLTTTADKVTAVFTVAQLNSTSSDFGDEYHVEFVVAGKTIQLFADRGAEKGPAKSPFGFGGGFYNTTDGDVVGTGMPVYDAKSNTVTVSGTVAQLKTAAGVEVAGKPVTRVIAATFDYLEAPELGGLTVFQYDDAAAPAGITLTVGVSCAGGGEPVPVPVPVPVPGVPPLPGPGGSDDPTAGCAHLTDKKGDAKPSAATVSGSQAGFGNDPTLDVTAATFRATTAEVAAYVSLDKYSKTTASGNGPRYEVQFTVNGKVINLYTQSPDATAAQVIAVQRAADVSTSPVDTGGRLDGSYDARLKVSATVNTARNILKIAVTTASLETVAGAPISGKTFTTLTVVTRMLTPTGGTFLGDTAPDTGSATWTVADNKCFGPPPAALANVGRTSVQYSDAAPLAARLTGSTGAPLAGRAVTFSLGSARVVAQSGPDGVARASVNPRLAAGTYVLGVSFAGDTVAGKAQLSVPFTVTLEATKISLKGAKKGSSRTITAKLVDDDGHALAGQTVTWTVAGKRVGSGRTNAAGMVTLTNVKPGSTVLAEFAGVAAQYASSKATTKA